MKIRFCFEKKNLLRFISHLDTNRTMIRALRSANLPVQYSLGFNPRPALTFALPLSLGIESECETMDVTTTVDIDLGEATAALNAFLPEDMQIKRANLAKTDPKHIAFADYTVTVSAENADISAPVADFLALKALPVIKKTKSKETEIDLKTCMEILSHTVNGNTAVFVVRLPAGSKDNVNPFLFSSALLKYLPDSATARICRTAVLDSDKNPFE